MVQETRDAAPGASERWELRIGATVYAIDDVPGKLRQIVLSPGSQQVAALIVRDPASTQEYLIPIEAVEQAEEDQIQLIWSMDEVRAAGKYEAAHLHTPERLPAGYAPGEAAISLRGGKRGEAAAEGAGPAGMAPIRVGLKVILLDGVSGHVSHVLADSASDHVTHFAVHQGIPLTPDRLAPVEWVSSIRPEAMILACTRSDLSMLPEYHPDEELAGKILDAWMRDPVAEELLIYSDIRAEVHDGVAILEGNVASSVQKRRLEELAAGVPGVLDVRNEVVSDDELTGSPI
jgi:hypothetical protein